MGIIARCSDNDFLSNNIHKNKEFHSVFLNNLKDKSEINEEFIGLHLDTFEFVKGNTTSKLPKSRYFLKLTNF